MVDFSWLECILERITQAVRLICKYCASSAYWATTCNAMSAKMKRVIFLMMILEYDLG